MSKITRQEVASLLPKRSQTAHKGNFGRVLVVAGSRSMCGAGYLCSKAALRSGAGLVFWALPKSMQPAFAAALPEAITVPLPEDEEGLLSEEGLLNLEQFISLRKPDVVVIGLGMGKSRLILPLIQKIKVPLVLDADVLNCLAETLSWERFFSLRRPVIFTPHLAEMARLLKEPLAADTSSKRFQAETLSRLTQGVAVLKGAGTLVSAKLNGKTVLRQNTTGSAALAKAGSGDVLSGVVAALWAQYGMKAGFNIQTAFYAALCGVYLHGLAGEIAAETKTDYGVLASDTADALPEAFGRILK